MTREEQTRIWHAMINSGVHLIPVSQTKVPVRQEWQHDVPAETRHEWVDNPFYWGFGIACGTDYFGIDVDADRDTILPAFLERLISTRPDLGENCYVEKTPHGAHVIFRCESNTLAGSPFAKRNGDPAKWDEKHQRNEREEEAVLLIESRAKGQQIITWPTEGYEWVYYDASNGRRLSQKFLCELSPISQEDIEVVCEVARSFNTYKPPVREKRRAVKPVAPERLAEFKRRQYKERKRGTFVCDPKGFYGSECTLERYEELLEHYDWQKGTPDAEGRIRYWRPGIACDPTNYSGNLYEKDGCWFLYVFTTNSELPANCGLPAWQFLMYEQGFTDAEHPTDILWEECLDWQDAWYEDQARSFEELWMPMVQHLERNQKFFNRRSCR